MTILQQISPMRPYEWENILKAVMPTEDTAPRSWICSVKAKGKINPLQVLSQTQYDKNARWWSRSVRKLSFKEIITTSQGFIFKQSKVVHPVFESDDLLNGKVLEKIKPVLREILFKDRMLQPIAASLKAMSTRSVLKHTAEKTKKIWGYIKWIIWSWFYDKTKRVEQIVQAVPNFDKTCEDYSAGFQRRLLKAIDAFEKDIGERRNQSIYNEAIELKKYPTPNEVKKWLETYGDGNYSPIISATARQYRRRICELLKIWEFVIDFRQKKFVAPEVRTISSKGEFKLEKHEDHPVDGK